MAPPLSPRERVEAICGAWMGKLPAPAQRALAGGKRVYVDGLELSHELQLLLATGERLGKKAFEETAAEEGIAAARAQIVTMTHQLSWPLAEVARSERLSIPGPGGPIDAVLHVPHGHEGPGPGLVFMHAGGHVLGSADSAEGACRLLANAAGIPVISLDYRHAPEHVFPAAVDDALAGFRWIAEHAADLGLDPERIAVGGDSAGGNLAAVAAQQTRGDDLRPAFQLLIYPVTDMSRERRSYELFESGFQLTRTQMDWYRTAYTGEDPGVLTDVRASPLLASDLTGLPPAFVMTAGFDPLRDEGEEYGRRMAAAGVPTVVRRYGRLVHGFANMTGFGRESREAMLEAAGALRMALAVRALSPVAAP